MKADLRQALLAKRQQVTKHERLLAAGKAADLFAQTEIFASFQQFACYLAMPNEFNCHPMIELIWLANKNCYLPLLSNHQNQGLAFASYHPDTILMPNRFGILEPQSSAIFPNANLEVVILPLVGFDLKGNRLGMGAGYYDRTFHFKKNRQTQPLLLGLGYDFQKIPAIPADEWDIKLDGVITESEFYFF